MKKLLFILLLAPAVAALGHDIYMFTQDQSRGFHLSDTGALWDKYHKESHDQWKTKISEFEQRVEELSPIKMPEAQIQVIEGAEEFIQNDGKGSVNNSEEENVMSSQTQSKPSTLQKFIGFLLEQKAILVFGGFALIIFALNYIISLLMPKKKEYMDARDVLRQKKRKGGGYGYKRN